LADEKKNRKVYLFAGGGTGGHLFPAVALAEKIKELDAKAEIHFVGTKRGLEAAVIPSLGYPLHRIAVRGMRRYVSLSNLFVPFALLWSFFQSLYLILKLRPCVIVGTGGYVSGPVLFMASLLAKPTLIQEQNSYPGVTTRLLARRVNRVCTSFEESFDYFEKKGNIRLTGNPVRKLDLSIGREEARQSFDLFPDKLTMFIFGGSQGAKAINQVVLACLDELMAKSGVQILWSCGKTSYDEVAERARDYPERIHVAEFIGEMERAYAASDFVLCRSGALTLAEVTLYGLPSILVPLPLAAAGHQEANARSLERIGAAEVILEEDIKTKELLHRIFDLIQNDTMRKKMSLAAKSAARPNATADIAREIIQLADQGKEM
jgi:UDP-N-acetylglucosamine--N-acetylmuramyl-(pentapeptide) pyrophosphoryl-undecaprenol N-acetylglucosamine transferase